MANIICDRISRFTTDSAISWFSLDILPIAIQAVCEIDGTTSIIKGLKSKRPPADTMSLKFSLLFVSSATVWTNYTLLL